MDLLTIIECTWSCVCSMMFIFLSHKSKWRLITCIRLVFFSPFVASAIVDDGFADNQKYEKQTLILSDRLFLAFVGSCHHIWHQQHRDHGKKSSYTYTHMRARARYPVKILQKYTKAEVSYYHGQVMIPDTRKLVTVIGIPFILCARRLFLCTPKIAHWFKQPMFTIISICLLRALIRNLIRCRSVVPFKSIVQTILFEYSALFPFTDFTIHISQLQCDPNTLYLLPQETIADDSFLSKLNIGTVGVRVRVSVITNFAVNKCRIQ